MTNVNRRLRGEPQNPGLAADGWRHPLKPIAVG